MNLPFSPTFFRQMDIYQQLKEYESQKGEKHLWEGEKAVLIWSASDQHQHLGSAIDTHHVTNALEYAAKNGYLAQADATRLKGSVSHILESLSVHEFGTPKSIPENKLDMKINRNGILAGDILIKTKNLERKWQYEKWSWDWYFVYYIAGFLLFLQTLKVVSELIEKLIK